MKESGREACERKGRTPQSSAVRPQRHRVLPPHSNRPSDAQDAARLRDAGAPRPSSSLPSPHVAVPAAALRPPRGSRGAGPIRPPWRWRGAGPAGRAYLQQVLVHDLQAAAAAHALAGGAAGARGHGPRRGGGRQGGGGRAGVLVGRRGALLRGAHGELYERDPPPASRRSGERRGEPRPARPIRPRAPAGPHRSPTGGSRREPELVRRAEAEGPERGETEPPAAAEHTARVPSRTGQRRASAHLLRGAAERGQVLILQPAHEHRVALPIHGPALPHTSSAKGGGAPRGCSGNLALSLCPQRLPEKSFVCEGVGRAARGRPSAPACSALPRRTRLRALPRQRTRTGAVRQQRTPSRKKGKTQRTPHTPPLSPRLPSPFIFVVCHSFSASSPPRLNKNSSCISLHISEGTQRCGCTGGIF